MEKPKPTKMVRTILPIKNWDTTIPVKEIFQSTGKIKGEKMRKVSFTVKLLRYDYKWHLVPLDKTAKQFVPPSFRSKYISFLTLFEKFKDGQVLRITIEKEKT